MKKLVLAMLLATCAITPLAAGNSCCDEIENNEENKAVICLTKDQACMVLAALHCFTQNKLARNDAPVEGDSEFPPSDDNADDIEELRQAVCELREQIAQCCKDSGGCDQMDRTLCKLAK